MIVIYSGTVKKKKEEEKKKREKSVRNLKNTEGIVQSSAPGGWENLH